MRNLITLGGLGSWDGSKGNVSQDFQTLKGGVDDLQAQLTAALARIAALEAANVITTVIAPNAFVGPAKGAFTGIVVQPNTGLVGNGTTASPLAGTPTQPDGVTLRQQLSAPTTLFDVNELRVPIPIGSWITMESVGGSLGTLASYGVATSSALGTAGTATFVFANGLGYARCTAAISGGTAASVANGSNSYRISSLGTGQQVTLIYRFGNIAGTGTPLADIRLRFGLYAGTLGNSAIQPTQGAGIRYCFDDGTSPSKWILEEYNGTTRNTSASFGTVVAGHDYRLVLKFTNPTGSQIVMSAEVWDITGGTVSTQTLNVAVLSLNQVSMEPLQMRMFNQSGANTRTIDLAYAAMYASGM